MNDLADAAARWQGRDVTLIVARENEVYRVHLPDGQQAALRLHRQGYQNPAAIRSELWWCSALAQGGQPVPAAIRSLEGEVLIPLSSGRYASCMGWIDGTPLGQAGVPLPGPPSEQAEMHQRLGGVLAGIHAATDQLALPPDFNRPLWDCDGLAGEAPFWGQFWNHPALTPVQSGHLRAVRDHLFQTLSVLPRTSPDFGLIHADVLRENVLVNDGSVSLIDFDDSGFGYRLYDLGTVLSQNQNEPARDDLRAALIEGYAMHRPVDPHLVDLFTLARCCASVGWTMPRLAPDHPVNHSHIARALTLAQRILG